MTRPTEEFILPDWFKSPEDPDGPIDKIKSPVSRGAALTLEEIAEQARLMDEIAAEEAVRAAETEDQKKQK